jgi:uncharacterized protein
MKRKLRSHLEIKELSKELSDEGTFEGLLSPYGNVDEGGDVVLPGAYTKTLREQGNSRKLLFEHESKMPIGKITLEDRQDGLWCKGKLLLDVPDGKTTYSLIKNEIVDGLSIGFKAIKDEMVNGIRHLKEIKLYEGSVVCFPMNERALITSVKSNGKLGFELKGDFNEEFSEIQLSDAGYQMRSALSCALSSLIWSGLKKEEIVSASEMVIEQFSAAYMAYIPAYIDMLADQYGDLETWSKGKFETKEGRKFSAATKEAMKSACDQIKAGHKSLLALLDDEADDDDDTSDEAVDDTATPGSKAAQLKSEPVNHSATLALLEKTTKEIVWTPSNRN